MTLPSMFTISWACAHVTIHISLTNLLSARICLDARLNVSSISHARCLSQYCYLSLRARCSWAYKYSNTASPTITLLSRSNLTRKTWVIPLDVVRALIIHEMSAKWLNSISRERLKLQRWLTPHFKQNIHFLLYFSMKFHQTS